jgi:hypothetical protein
MWDGNRANLKFDTFRDKITVRQDRSEESWYPKLIYDPRIESIKNRYTSILI